MAQDSKYKSFPIVFGQISIQNNKDYLKSLGILALPMIQIYGGSDGLVESFPCGPSKVPILKKKLLQVLKDRVDPDTLELRVTAPIMDCVLDQELSEAEPCMERDISLVNKQEQDETGPSLELSVAGVVLSGQDVDHLRSGIPYFRDLTDGEFDLLMKKAKLLTFEEHDIIMLQGKRGKSFYVIESGEVEISVRSFFEDPLTTPSSYLGPVINRLQKKDYFGERSLITGEPRAASIRATEKTRCFTFDVSDMPTSSILSGKLLLQDVTDERMEQINDKYGVEFIDINKNHDQFKNVSVASQQRGSANSPRPIKGVDTDDDMEETLGQLDTPESLGSSSQNEELIFSLLMRFKMVRHAKKGFDYIMRTKPSWGDLGQMRRRLMLVSRLPDSLRMEFIEVFKLIDTSHDGMISLRELRRFMEVIGDEKTDTELLELINKSDPSVDGNAEISLTEFLGVMAEAEFFFLFKDTFTSLDPDDTGFVRAGDLKKVLQGVRDLISDDRKSIIDVEDQDLLIDYERFSSMLLGSPLKP
mmetsp:Transcript_2866/g.4179  ORF Transcript_2866/g.4179 Transcript_2866/m.4179 type:complete len:530 (-) Transcript_2866:652-2241(-)